MEMCKDKNIAGTTPPTMNGAQRLDRDIQAATAPATSEVTIAIKRGAPLHAQHELESGHGGVPCAAVDIVGTIVFPVSTDHHDHHYGVSLYTTPQPVPLSQLLSPPYLFVP